MAKIYETKQDVKRDAAARSRDIGAAISGASFSGLVMSAFTAGFCFLGKRFVSESAKDLFGGSARKNLQDVGWFALGMTGASAASLFAGHYHKNSAEAELKKLGPEEIVTPKEYREKASVLTGYVHGAREGVSAGETTTCQKLADIEDKNLSRI